MQTKKIKFRTLCKKGVINFAHMLLGTPSVALSKQLLFQCIETLSVIQELQLLHPANKQKSVTTRVTLQLFMNTLGSSIDLLLLFSLLGVLIPVFVFLLSQINFGPFQIIADFTHMSFHLLTYPIWISNLQLLRLSNFIPLSCLSCVTNFGFLTLYIVANKSFRPVEILNHRTDLQLGALKVLFTISSSALLVHYRRPYVLEVLLLLMCSLGVSIAIISMKLSTRYSLLLRACQGCAVLSQIFRLDWMATFLLATLTAGTLISLHNKALIAQLLEEKPTFLKYSYYKCHLGSRSLLEQQLFQRSLGLNGLEEDRVEASFQASLKSNLLYSADVNMGSQIFLGMYYLSRKEKHIDFQTELIACAIKQNLQKEFHRTNLKSLELETIVKSLKQEEKLQRKLAEMSEIILDMISNLSSNKHNLKNAQIRATLLSNSGKLQKIDDYLQRKIDFRSQKMKGVPSTNSLTLKIIQSYYSLCFQNIWKAQNIEQEIKDLCTLGPPTNKALIRNEAVLFTVDLFDQAQALIKPNQKRLKDFLGTDVLPQCVNDLLPNFLISYHHQKIKDLIDSGVSRSQVLKSYYQHCCFLYPCDLALHYDYIGNQFRAYLVLKRKLTNEPQHILFALNGKILGVSKRLFQFLQTLDDSTMLKLSVERFLKEAFIQFYIPNITEIVYQYRQGLENELPEEQTYQGVLSMPSNLEQCLQSSSYIVSNQPLPQQLARDGARKLFRQSKQQTKQHILAISQANKYSDIDMLNQEYCEKVSNLIIPGMKAKSLEFTFSLSLKSLSNSNSKINFFVLTIKKLENFPDNFEEAEEEEASHLLQAEPELDSKITCIEEFIKIKKINHPLVYLALTEVFVIFGLLLMLFLNQETLEKDILEYQTQINFLIFPQALTFSYAATFLIQWNKVSEINQLFNLTPYVEYQRQQKLIYAYNLWKGIDLRYTVELDKYGAQNGINSFDVTYVNAKGQKLAEKSQIFEFYQQCRERMHRMFKQNNFSNVAQQNYSLLMANGFMRQNIFTILKYHDFVMNKLIDEVSDKIESAKLNTQLLIIIECIFSCLIFATQLYFLHRMNDQTAQIIKVLQFMDQNSIIERTHHLHSQRSGHSHAEVTQLISVEHRIEADYSLQLVSSAKSSSIKLSTYTHHQFSDFIAPSIKSILVLIILIAAYQVHADNYENFKSSLLLTLQYIRFKKLFDSSILVGELIKTEHFIPNNPIQLINQSESIELFFHYANSIQPEFNLIVDQLIKSDHFNQTMKSFILDIFSKNLCTYFTRFLVFCNKTQIKLTYLENDSYTGLLEKGISGVIQTYMRMVSSEFNFERENKRYDFNKSRVVSYLNTQLHQNIFVQYFQDIQSCFFTCFSYFITETSFVGGKFISFVHDFYLASSIILIAIFLTVTGVWLYKKWVEFNQLKYCLLLLPPSIVKKESFIKLFLRIRKSAYSL